MKFIATFFWVFLLAHMVTYVAGSILGATYDFMEGSILGVGISLLIFVVSALFPKDEKQEA